MCKTANRGDKARVSALCFSFSSLVCLVAVSVAIDEGCQSLCLSAEPVLIELPEGEKPGGDAVSHGLTILVRFSYPTHTDERIVWNMNGEAETGNVAS